MTDTNKETEQVVQTQVSQNSDMPKEAKEALVYLMRQGVMFQAQKPALFSTLLQYQNYIRRHLSEVYLVLLLDEKQGLAFVSRLDNNVDEESGVNPDDITSLITRRTLSLNDTLILLVLRKYYQERESAGEQKIIIDTEKLSSLLIPFTPLTDHASLERKKISARLKEFSKRRLLAPISGEDERYEITPVIRYVVSADFLESLLVEYTKLAESYVESTETTESVKEEK